MLPRIIGSDLFRRPTTSQDFKAKKKNSAAFVKVSKRAEHVFSTKADGNNADLGSRPASMVLQRARASPDVEKKTATLVENPAALKSATKVCKTPLLTLENQLSFGPCSTPKRQNCFEEVSFEVEKAAQDDLLTISPSVISTETRDKPGKAVLQQNLLSPRQLQLKDLSWLGCPRVAADADRNKFPSRIDTGHSGPLKSFRPPKKSKTSQLAKTPSSASKSLISKERLHAIQLSAQRMSQDQSRMLDELKAIDLLDRK